MSTRLIFHEPVDISKKILANRRIAMRGPAIAIVGIGLSVAAPAWAGGPEVTGAGSTFVDPLMARWAGAYREKTGIAVKYDSVGSGMGITQIKAGKVDFGASDMPMKSDDLGTVGFGQFPIVIGGVVPVVNLEGVTSGQIRFTGPVLADIFLGKLKKWSDPAIQGLNPDLKLPDGPITIVHRLDSSGTTFNWANYLSKVSAEWRDKVGEGASLDWPAGVAGKGNEGVATFVNRLKRSIGYVEYTYALKYKMIVGLIQNSAGRFVKPDASSFQAAAESADWANTKDFYLVMTNAGGENAYPVTATTFILMHRKSRDGERAYAAFDFFRWALTEGSAQAKELDYVPLPGSLVEQIGAYWKTNFQ